MSDAQDRTRQAVEQIWLRYRPQMFERLAVVEEAVRLAAEGQLDAERRAAARREAHKLAGSLGTFGLDAGTEHARSIELAFAGGDCDVHVLRRNATALRAALEARG